MNINAFANVVQRQHRRSYAGVVKVAIFCEPTRELHFTATDPCTADGRLALEYNGSLVLELIGDIRTIREGICELRFDPMPDVHVAIAIIPVALAVEAAYDGYPAYVEHVINRNLPFFHLVTSGARYGIHVLCMCEVDDGVSISYTYRLEHHWLAPRSLACVNGDHS